jgi:hypothetical protein
MTRMGIASWSQATTKNATRVMTNRMKINMMTGASTMMK